MAFNLIVKTIAALGLLYLTGIPAVAALPEYGQVIRVIFVDAVTTMYCGTPVVEVDTDIFDRANRLVIKKGTPVKVNLWVQAPKRLGLPGNINITFLETTNIDGLPIPLEGSMKLTGDNKRPKVMGVGIGTGLFITPMFLYLLKKGGHVMIPAGSKSIVPRVAENTKAM